MNRQQRVNAYSGILHRHSVVGAIALYSNYPETADFSLINLLPSP